MTRIIMFVSKEFKTIITRDNKYEEYVLELMNLSSVVFPNKYKRINIQANGEPDFIDIDNGDIFDAKLVVSESQCRCLCGENDATGFYNELQSFNNEIFDSIIKEDEREFEIERIMEKQLMKDSTKHKNIIFLFTFPVGATFSSSLIDSHSSTYLTILLSKMKRLANNRRIFAISPMCDGNYELREMNRNRSEFVRYVNLDKYFKWYIE